MYTFKEDTTFIGVSELRTHMDRIIVESRKRKVLIGRRNKPVAVLMDIEQYNEMEKLVEDVEDFLLASEAKKRHGQSSASQYLPLETFKKKYHIT